VHSPLWSPQANVILETKVKQENENEKLLAKRARKFKAENTSKYINYISFISIIFFGWGLSFPEARLIYLISTDAFHQRRCAVSRAI